MPKKTNVRPSIPKEKDCPWDRFEVVEGKHVEDFIDGIHPEVQAAVVKAVGDFFKTMNYGAPREERVTSLLWTFKCEGRPVMCAAKRENRRGRKW